MGVCWTWPAWPTAFPDSRARTRLSTHSARTEPKVPPESADSLEAAVRPARGALPLDQFAAIVDQSDDAILSKDGDGIITTWNPAATRIYGYTAEEAIGQPISILIPDHRRGEELRILERVFAGERLEHYETERVTKDGRQVDVALTISPIQNERGEIVLASVIARDVTARHRSLQLASRMQSLTTALSREATPERAVEVLLEHAVAALGADAGAVGLLTRSGEEIELAGSVGYQFEGPRDWSRFPLGADLPMSQAVRNGEAVWSTSADDLRRRFSGIEAAPVRFSALAVVPLSAGARPFGAASLSFVAPREFDSEEQAFLLGVAQQAAYSLDRARLFAAEQELNERLGFLAEASQMLAGSLDPETALSRLATLSVGRIADWCGIELLTDEGELRNVAVAHTDPERVRYAQELRERYPVDPDAETGVPNVIRTGQPELYSEVTDDLLVEVAEDEEHLALMRELGLVSVMVVPLVARGRALGAVTFVSSESGRRYDEEDLELAQDLARRAALSIDNAMLYRREHEAAVTLQRALLPQSLPELEGVEFAALYEPAAEGMEVGGDWYEVVVRDDGTVGAMIGDVAGRGIRAAAVMGRIRPALRAYVLDGYGPAEAVERVDRLIKEAGRSEMTTVFQLQFDPASGAAEYVRAGHPPALLRLPGGEVTELDGGGTPPLGVFDDFQGHSHPAELPPGSLLLLYTDGLIERRGEDLDAGLARLKGLLARAPAGAEECLQWLASEVSADEIPDDVAMLAVATAG